MDRVTKHFEAVMWFTTDRNNTAVEAKLNPYINDLGKFKILH